MVRGALGFGSLATGLLMMAVSSTFAAGAEPVLANLGATEAATGTLRPWEAVVFARG